MVETKGGTEQPKEGEKPFSFTKMRPVGLVGAFGTYPEAHDLTKTPTELHSANRDSLNRFNLGFFSALREWLDGTLETSVTNQKEKESDTIPKPLTPPRLPIGRKSDNDYPIR